MRYTVANRGTHFPNGRLPDILMKEYVRGLEKLETYQQFKAGVEASKTGLVELLTKLKSEGKRVVGYGATSKSTTITNYCGLTPDLIDCIYDTTPIKQGKFSPGTHIPIKPFDEFYSNPPEYTLLFAWNHVQEIMAKEKNYKGKWIVYVPEVKILES